MNGPDCLNGQNNTSEKQFDLDISVPIPNHPHLSNILVRAAADPSFCVRLMADPAAALTGFDLPPADRAILRKIRANSLPDLAAKLKTKMGGTPWPDGG